MEKTYLLNKETASYFSGLCPFDPVNYIQKGKVAFGTICDGEPAAVIFATVGSMVYIDWLYVNETYRGAYRGYMLIDILKENLYFYHGDGYIYTSCDEGLREYFERDGFDFSDEDRFKTYSSTVDEMAEIPLPKVDESVKHIADLSRADKNIIYQTMLSDREMAMPLEMPIEWGDYMPESVVRIRDGKLKAMLLFKKYLDEIDVSFAYSAEGDVKSLFALVASAMDEITDEYDEETVITATAVNEKSDKLFSQLFPDAEGSYMIRGRLYKEM